MEEELQVVEYGYSILTYAGRYDPRWIEEIQRLRKILTSGERRRIFVTAAPVNTFPEENVYHVMEYLDSKDLRVSALVSRRWKCLSSRPALWSNLLRSKFGVSMDAIKSTIRERDGALSAKEVYKEMQKSFNNVLRAMEGAKMKRMPFIPSYMMQHAIAV